MASLLILAAGMGSRYGSTKQFQKFGPRGRLLIDYTIYDAKCAGFDKFVFVIRKEIEELFNKLIVQKWKNRINICKVYQEIDSLPAQYHVPKGRKKPWGTAHAVWMAQNIVNEPFAVVNADDFYGREAIQQAQNRLNSMSSQRKNAFIIAYKLGNTLSPNGAVSRGICAVNHENYLIKINERTSIEAKSGKIILGAETKKDIHLKTQTLTCMNLLGFTPSVFETIRIGFQQFYQNLLPDSQAEYYIASVLNLLIGEGTKISVIPTHSTWFGVTYHKDKEWVNRRLTQLHASGEYPNDF